MSAQLAQALRRIAEFNYSGAETPSVIARQALAAHEAAPQQEPAITVTIDDLDLVQDWAESRLPPGTHKLYAAPQQEPVAEVYRAHPGGRSRNIGLNDVRPLRGATLPPPGTKLYAAPQQAQAPGWQDIATAPKDGSLLLLFERYEDEPFIGSWQYGKWTASRTHYDTDGNACVTDRVYSDGVSHWMPLPAAPQQGSNT